MLNTLVFILLTINLYADKNWIQIEPINKTKIAASKTKFDVNLSQIEPINKMMKNATVIKQLIDATSKKDEPTNNEKNCFVVNTKDAQ